MPTTLNYSEIFDEICKRLRNKAKANLVFKSAYVQGMLDAWEIALNVKEEALIRAENSNNF